MQKRERTVQGELESGLLAITGQAVRVTGAGRTDAGVHALGQVVHLRPPWRHSMADLRRAWNANLPPDIAIRAAVNVPAGFHARFSARSRLYRYRIYSMPVRAPLRDRYAWHVSRPLDVGLMDRTAATLVGRHDLASFGSAPRGENTVRTVFRARCEACAGLIQVEVEADAFLQHMMRRVVATLVAVGLGRLSVEGFQAIIRSRELSRAAGMAPPNGLCLVAVRYDPELLDWSLPPSDLWQKESCLE